jgi:hypothetical protein
MLIQYLSWAVSSLALKSARISFSELICPNRGAVPEQYIIAAKHGTSFPEVRSSNMSLIKPVLYVFSTFGVLKQIALK